MKTKTKKSRKPGSGRTKGSFSFVKITLGELKQVLARDDIQIQVGRKWAAPLFPDKVAQKVQDLGVVPPSKNPVVKVIDLNNEENTD